jgi:hypothetical protein
VIRNEVSDKATLTALRSRNHDRGTQSLGLPPGVRLPHKRNRNQKRLIRNPPDPSDVWSGVDCASSEVPDPGQRDRSGEEHPSSELDCGLVVGNLVDWSGNGWSKEGAARGARWSRCDGAGDRTGEGADVCGIVGGASEDGEGAGKVCGNRILPLDSGIGLSQELCRVIAKNQRKTE